MSHPKQQNQPLYSQALAVIETAAREGAPMPSAYAIANQMGWATAERVSRAIGSMCSAGDITLEHRGPARRALIPARNGRFPAVTDWSKHGNTKSQSGGAS